MSNPGTISMGHGAGGRLTRNLIRDIFQKHFGPNTDEGHDSAVVPIETSKIAICTDSFVVTPLFFPGGDIGKLSVCGVVNDLLMSGAVPRFLTASFILEEGLPIETLDRIVRSMSLQATTCGVHIVAGDTKVVERGRGDGVYISMAGVGEKRVQEDISPRSLQVGDAVLLSGDIGRHGLAVLNAREQFFPQNEIESDCASLLDPVLGLLESEIEIHCMRDLTRGGLSTVLVELAESRGLGLIVEEENIPVSSSVKAACELLGFDPGYLANEGRFVVIVPEKDADKAIQTLHRFAVSSNARRIGTVQQSDFGYAALRTPYGTERAIDRLTGLQLPRIC